MALAKNVLRGGMYNYMLASQAEVFTPQEARAEYARLRKIANRRLERLGASEFKNERAYKNWSSGFEALPPGIPERDIRKALFDVARYLNLKTSSISGARKAREKFVATMKKRGYGFINMANAEQFGDFMKEVKKHEEYSGYDSKRVVALYHTAKQKRVDPESLAQDLKYWMEHDAELELSPRSDRIVTADEFLAQMGVEREKGVQS